MLACLLPLVGLGTAPAGAQLSGPVAYAHADLSVDDATALGFSPNGRFLAVGDEDGTVSIFDVEAARRVQRVEVSGDPVVGVRFAPDGTSAFAATEDGRVVEVDLVGGGIVRSAEVDETLRGFDASADGRLFVVAGDDGHVELLTDRLQRQALLESPNFFGKRIVWAAFGSGGGEVFAAAEDEGRTAFWALGEPDPIRVGELVREELRAFARDRDGQLLALGVKGLSLRRDPSAGGAIRAAAHHRVRLLDWNRGRVIREIDGLPAEVRAVAVSPDRSLVAVALADGSLSAYSTREGSPVMEIHRGAEVGEVAFGPTGAWLAAAIDDGRVAIWELSGLTVADASAAGDVVREGDVLAESGKYEFTTGREPLLAVVEPFTMAVLDLDHPGVEADLAAAVTNLLVSRLANVSAITMVERSAIERVLDEIDLQTTGLTSAEDAARIGRILNAERVLLGNVNQLGSSLTVQVRLVETQSARVVGAREILCRDCRPEDLPRALSLLVGALVER